MDSVDPVNCPNNHVVPTCRQPTRMACWLLAATTASFFVPAMAANSNQGGRDVYAALRTQAHATLEVGGGRINVVFADEAPGLDRDRALRWIRRSAEAVATYFGRFPVDEVGIQAQHYRSAKNLG